MSAEHQPCPMSHSTFHGITSNVFFTSIHLAPLVDTYFFILNKSWSQHPCEFSISTVITTLCYTIWHNFPSLLSLVETYTHREREIKREGENLRSSSKPHWGDTTSKCQHPGKGTEFHLTSRPTPLTSSALPMLKRDSLTAHKKFTISWKREDGSQPESQKSHKMVNT